MECPELGAEPGDGFDQDSPPIRGVGDSLHEAGLLEPIDHARSRSCRKARQLGEPANRQAALEQQDVQALDVRAGQPQTFSDGLAEQRCLASALADRPQDRGYEFVSRCTA